MSGVDGWMRFSVLREAAGEKWAVALDDAEVALRRGVFVPMHNPRGPVETCLATSAYNLVELWHEGYRLETGARKGRKR